MNLRSLMRVGDVTRWHIVRVARPQTLAEHLYKTWLLTDELYTRIGLPEDGRVQTLQWALTHDLPEILTGDAPTPVKRDIERRAGDPDIWRRLERDVMIDSEKTSATFLQPLVDNTPTQYVVKIADCIEGWHFLGVEGIGPHADDTRKHLLNRAQAVAAKANSIWPDYEWAWGLSFVTDALTNGKIEHVGM